MNITMKVEKTLYSNNIFGISPLAAPAIYSRHFGKKEDSIATLANDGRILRLETIAHLDDPKTGFYGDVMLDKGTGHAVILYKGMDVPFKDEGNGRTGFLRDAFAAAQALITGAKNRQTPFAEKLYLDTVKNPNVKTVEVVGFSLGTLHTNYIAAKYGVKATVLADLGIAGRGLKGIFNNNANDVAQAESHLKANLTDLRMHMDPVSMLGTFRHHGKVIDLDQGGLPDPAGMAHLASVYNERATDLLVEEGNPEPVPHSRPREIPLSPMLAPLKSTALKI